MTFADRLRRWDRPLALYEAVPPDRNAPDGAAADRIERMARLLTDQSVDAVNVPEIRVEAGDDSDRTRGELKKRDPRGFGRCVADRIGGDTDVVVNHVTVHDPPTAQERWFEAAYDEYGIKNVVVVGGGSSGIDYPGPSVSEGVELARTVGKAGRTDPCLGGIIIPTRRRDGFDEPDRMLAKQRAGIEFFTSQVVFDPEPVTRLLGDYDDTCRAAGVDAAPVFLSFAPITGRKNARFLEQLGVDIPSDIREWILGAGDHTARRSIRVAEHVLEEVLTAIRRENLAVPVGINVGHVMQYNVEPSEQLLDQLISLLEWHEQGYPTTTRPDPAH